MARTARINPSFTAAERDELVAAARRVGLTPTGFCAVAALAAARSQMTIGSPQSVQEESLAQVQVELFDLRTAFNRVGTNLNQAVTAFNGTGEPPPWLRTVVAMCARTLVAADELISSVHRRLP